MSYVFGNMFLQVKNENNVTNVVILLKFGHEIKYWYFGLSKEVLVLYFMQTEYLHL